MVSCLCLVLSLPAAVGIVAVIVIYWRARQTHRDFWRFSRVLGKCGINGSIKAQA